MAKFITHLGCIAIGALLGVAVVERKSTQEYIKTLEDELAKQKADIKAHNDAHVDAESKLSQLTIENDDLRRQLRVHRT